MKKTLEELDIMDDFLMNALAGNPEIGEDFCRSLLSVLLQKKIGALRVVTQRVISALTPQLRGIRMDVEVEEWIEEEQPCGTEETTKGKERISERLLNVYDLEPHLKTEKENLPRHNRFYQAKIDSRYLKSGEKDFQRLPNLYVITLLDYDPFGKDYMMYTFRNCCRELPELEYKDGLQFIYFYTNGRLGGCQEIKNMLMYIRNSSKENVVDDATSKIHQYVEQVKIRPEVKLEYMKFEEIIAYERRDAARDAKKDTRIMDIQEVLEEYGVVPDTLKQRLEEEEDEGVLRKWLKLAARVSSIDEFLEKMDL